MNNQEPYILLCFARYDDLAAAANTAIRDGYVPLGAPYILRFRDGDSGHLQALILP